MTIPPYGSSTLTKWAVGVVFASVLALAGWGLSSDRESMASDIKEVRASAASASATASQGRTDVAVLKAKLEHISSDVQELKGMVRTLLRRSP